MRRPEGFDAALVKAAVGKYKLVVSDFHIGSGHSPGVLNPWESFNEDERFCEFLRYYSSGPYAEEEVELIINGDFYDFLQVPVNGAFPDRITESLAVAKLKACMDGHPEVHAALATFAAMPRKRVTVIPGNHDMEWVFPGVQEAFRERICGSRTDDRVQVICERSYYEFDGVQVHHGQQFEIMHYHNFLELFLKEGQGEPILNLPFGSQYILHVQTRLKQDRPYIDKVRPMKAYVIRAIVFDLWFFLKVCWLTGLHFVSTRLFNFRHFGARMRQNWTMLLEMDFYPDLVHHVRHLFTEHPRLHTVILGHTHVPMIRRMDGGRQYINTGCWTDTVSFDLGSYGQRSQPTYVHIEYPEDQPDRPVSKLRVWSGSHALFKDLKL